MEKPDPENLNDGVSLRAYCLGYLGMSLSEFDRLSLTDIELIQFWRSKRDQRDDLMMGILCTLVSRAFGNKNASVEDFIPGLQKLTPPPSSTLHTKFKALVGGFIKN